MPLSPLPPPLEELRNRPFSFYPAILNMQHNQWRYRRATWSEVLVVNTRTGQEIWIPRRFLGEISRIEDPVVIVGLVRELEYRAGAVWPYQRRVIEMPIAVGDSGASVQPRRGTPAPVIGIRLESKSDSAIFRLVGSALVMGIVAAYFVVNFYRDSLPRPHTAYTTKGRSYWDLTAKDNYDSVVRKIGRPAGDRWQGGTGALQYRALSYPERGYTVILMGVDRQSAAYVGAVDWDWRPVHWVRFPAGDSSSLLRHLKPF
jgi:hypothetical protein